MEFKINKKISLTNESKYEQHEIDIVIEFAKECRKEFKDLIRAIILFGSTARKKIEEQKIDNKKLTPNQKINDIDVLIIVDDVRIEFSPELVQTYRIILEKIVAKISKKLHVTSLRFTNFWEYIRAGDPIAINILRDGIPIIDSGFFEPLQILLYQGRIRPSPESIQNYLSLAPQTLQNSKQHILQATLDLYWAVIDAAHAALMSINEIPPSPAHVADMLEEKLVKKGLLHKKHAYTMRNFYALGKSIMHGELLHVSGDQYDVYYKEAYSFVMDMKSFIEKK
ncbi:MAG: nucleotidyltransferase domain-containing protein [Candidatus Woesearchaeota archaeon]